MALPGLATRGRAVGRAVAGATLAEPPTDPDAPLEPERAGARGCTGRLVGTAVLRRVGFGVTGVKVGIKPNEVAVMIPGLVAVRLGVIVPVEVRLGV